MRWASPLGLHAAAPAMRITQEREAPLLAATPAHLTLLNAFQLVCDGASVSLPMSAQRVVAFVALRRSPLLRSFVAGSLWPDTHDERAQASLRSALWRLHRLGYEIVETAGPQLRLGRDVRVDLHETESSRIERSTGPAATASISIRRRSAATSCRTGTTTG